MPPTAVEQARSEEREAALRLAFGHLPRRACEARVTNALAMMGRGELDPCGLLVVRGRSGLRGAMLAMLLPGSSGLVWPPRADAAAGRQEIEDALVRHSTAWLRGQGAAVGQALLLPEETVPAEPLVRNGYRHVTELLFLRHDLGGEGGTDPPCLAFESYDRCDQELFLRTLMGTYEGTLDCPELDGYRTSGEILKGHQGQGRFDPERWWLVREGGCPVGVLLLTRVADGEALDISYLGVVPAARGRGLGRALTRKALAEARRAGVGQLTLAVDRRNAPALNLYLELGFQPDGEREVYLALWGNKK